MTPRVLAFVALSACLVISSSESGGKTQADGQAAQPAAVSHPRLFLGTGGPAQLQQKIGTTHRAKWQTLKTAVDASLKKAPPEYKEPQVGGDSTRPGTFNDEMLWQREFGYVLPGMALVAMLDPEPKYFELVRKWALKPGQYPLWGAGIYENTGLAAKHQLFGISIVYDWLYDRLSEQDRASLRETLRHHGRILYEAAEGINDRGWWKDTWRQNHAWNGYQALAVTAIALAGEEPAADVWLQKALWGGRNIIRELPDEGAYEEGLPYWGYGMEALMRFLEATRPYSSDKFYAAPYFRNTPSFRLYMAGPRLEQITNFGDGKTTEWHAGQSMMYRLASEYQNPVTQWLAEKLPERKDIDAACWSFLWYDPRLKPTPPAPEALSLVFPKTGFAGARTDWTEEAVTLHFRSGKADVSHSHLDVNNFLLNVAGEWLIRDYGYGEVGPGYFNKNTIYFSTGTLGHNCLVINGGDQRRDDASEGKITDFTDTGRLVWWRSDASACYDGAESVARELVMVRPDTRSAGDTGLVLVRDVARVSAPSTFAFMLQPGGKVSLSGRRFEIAGKEARVVGHVLTPEQTLAETAPGFGPRINVPDPFSLRISAPGRTREVEFIVALIPLRTGVPEPAVSSRGRSITVADMEVTFSPEGRSAPKLREAGSK